jgi:hypothetical protein
MEKRERKKKRNKEKETKKKKKKKNKKKKKKKKGGTNRQNKGLISADRGTKATLMLTIPRSIFKSSTKDLSLSIFALVIRSNRLDWSANEIGLGTSLSAVTIL